MAADPNTAAEQAATFGRDVYCAESLRPGRFASGLMVVAQNAFHRLTTPRGMLRGGEDEQSYGIDLIDSIGAISSPSAEREIPQQIRSELLKDPRIVEVRATLTRQVSGATITYLIEIDADTNEGPFELVVSASAVSLELLKLVTAEAA